MIKDGDWDPEEVVFLNEYSFLTAKPQIYLVNMAKEDYMSQNNTWFPKIKKHLKDSKHDQIINYSVDYEKDVLELGGYDEDERDQAEKMVDKLKTGAKSKI